jgi:hypothetical protein
VLSADELRAHAVRLTRDLPRGHVLDHDEGRRALAQLLDLAGNDVEALAGAFDGNSHPDDPDGFDPATYLLFAATVFAGARRETERRSAALDPVDREAPLVHTAERAAMVMEDLRRSHGNEIPADVIAAAAARFATEMTLADVLNGMAWEHWRLGDAGPSEARLFLRSALDHLSSS